MYARRRQPPLSNVQGKRRDLVIATPTEAKACLVCRHWHQLAGRDAGECRNPLRRWGVTYRLPDGSDQHVEWWTTGWAATCNQWEEKL